MPLRHHPLVKEFPEHHDRIHELKISDGHFHRLMNDYENLDKEIFRAKSDVEPTDDTHLKELGVRRVQLKDQIYALIQQ
ncbi:MAG: DUF465 domain-containing protein [Nitrospirota bacterium]|nr:DUF465 domain-containing protein [Nitrospirota bacterium]